MEKRDDATIEVRDDCAGCYEVVLCKEIYHRDAVLRAAYKYSDIYYVRIEPSGDAHVKVIFEAKNKEGKDGLDSIKEFCNDALDFQIRYDLEVPNGKIREIIYKHAFIPLSNIPSTEQDNVEI